MNGPSCADVRELVDAIASGDAEPDAAVRSHVETCPACASALASARKLEAALAAREAPAAPARFTQTVLQAVRRERWQSEQRVDQLFNVAMVAAATLIVLGVLAAFNIETLLSITRSLYVAVRNESGSVVRDAIPVVNTYAMAAMLLLSALGMWWYVERRLQF
jgi:anti-sigma factor RsiW